MAWLQNHLPELAMSAAMAWGAGLRLYLVVFVVGMLGKFGYVPLPDTLKLLMNPLVLGAAGFMACVEFFADKIPWLDSAWDAVHTFLRIPAGAALAAGMLGDGGEGVAMAAAIIGGTLTAGTHFGKAGTRAVANTSPEPFSNVGLSLVEDTMVAGGLALAVANPDHLPRVAAHLRHRIGRAHPFHPERAHGDHQQVFRSRCACMTGRERGWRAGIWRLIVAFALLLFCWSHRHALQLSGFADDLGLLAELPMRVAQGTLRADVLAKFSGPLWPGSTMWRPLPYVSFALDAALWGNAPGLWRITNLLLHLGVATLTGLIAARLTRLRLAGAAAFASALLTPWAPEVTLWLVGRFDGWATLTILVSLWAAMKSGGADRWLTVSLATAIAAYMSKESALMLPVWIVLVVALQSAQHRWSLFPRDGSATTQANGLFATVSAALRAHRLLLVSHFLLAAIYLVWRSHLFSGQAIAVYASSPEYRVLPLIARITSHLAFPVALAPLAPAAAVICAAIGVLYLLLVLRRTSRLVALVGALMTASVIVAVAIYFANPPGAGEGYRLYYLATIGVALIIAEAVREPHKTSLVLLITFMIALATWQSRVVAEWTPASRSIDGASQAMTSAAKTLATSEFGLVLMPDMMGHVPIARNAQGALLTRKDGTSIARDFFIIFTPPQLAEWHQLSQEDVVGKLSKRATAPARITRYFCFDTRRQSLEDLGYWQPGTLADWTARWRDAVAIRCPDLAQ